MIIPSRRWFVVAAALGAVALLALAVPPFAIALIVADALWIGLLLADGWAAAQLRWSDVDVTREAAPVYSVGRSLPVTLVWRNRGSRALDVRVREEVAPVIALAAPSERVLRLEPGAVVREELEVRPLARGKGTVDGCTCAWPARLASSGDREAIERPWAVTVYPNLVGASLRALPTQAQRRREAGQRNVRRIGEGRVFESLKEWVPGDDTRTIDWKATARRGKVMARQYEDERRQQVLIVIDAGRLLTAEVEGTPRLETVTEAALHLAYSAVAHDDNVGLMAFADEVQLYVAPARGRRRCVRCWMVCRRSKGSWSSRTIPRRSPIWRRASASVR